MIRRMLMLAVLTVVTTVTPGHAVSEDFDYTTPGSFVVRAGGATIPFGVPVASFTPTFTPRQVRVVDDLTIDVGWFLCQDVNANALCGDAGDVVAEGCANGEFQNLISFRAGVLTEIYVDVYNSSCSEFATSGSIRIRD